MKKIIFIMFIALIGLSANSHAQSKQYYSLGWDVSFPTGGFSDFISDPSLRGFAFTGNIFVTDAVSVGFKFGYNSYHENKGRETYNIDNGLAMTAASYNYAVSAPIQVGAYYHFNNILGGVIEPYVGLGLGVNYIDEELLVQDWDVYDSQWAFLLNPEVGVRIPFGELPLALGVRLGYNYNFNSFNALGVDYDNFQSLNLGLSLSYTIK
jgi:opacity protein-like surface antigen